MFFDRFRDEDIPVYSGPDITFVYDHRRGIIEADKINDFKSTEAEYTENKFWAKVHNWDNANFRESSLYDSPPIKVYGLDQLFLTTRKTIDHARLSDSKRNRITILNNRSVILRNLADLYRELLFLLSQIPDEIRNDDRYKPGEENVWLPREVTSDEKRRHAQRAMHIQEEIQRSQSNNFNLPYWMHHTTKPLKWSKLYGNYDRFNFPPDSGDA